ncbi:MAG: phosphate acetyltransferase [Sedimentisphaerales bacterium]|nr:phosphate acetyltransferase [Sedimentisphaerales bacterium]
MASFLDQIFSRAASSIKTIALPEGCDARTIEAASVILKKKFANIIVLGSQAKVLPLLDKYNVDAKAINLIDPATDPRRQEFAQYLYELRKSKGMTMEQAEKLALDEVYFATVMVKKGLADGLVSGACHSTADTLRPALQIIKPAEGMKTVSSMFFMCWPDKILLYADCGLIEDPTEDQIVDIAVSTAKTGLQFGIQPRVAILSYSSKGSASGPNAKKMANASASAKDVFQKEFGDKVIVDGELQFDAAYVPSVAAQKAPNSPLKGNANTFVFPDLGAGNLCYKSTQRLAGAEAYGPIVQGLARPVNDLSRGCSSDDIVATVAITAIQAMG